MVLYMHEIAERLGCSIDQAYDLADDGSLVAINIASAGVTRRELRVPIEAWRNFILARMTGPTRSYFLRTLPPAVLAQLRAELAAMSAD